MILGAIAEAGGALLFTFWLIVCVEFDSLMFLFVLSDVVLFWLIFLLLVVTFESDVDELILVLVFVLVLLLVELFVLFTFWFTVEFTVEVDVDVDVLTLLLLLVLVNLHSKNLLNV